MPGFKRLDKITLQPHDDGVSYTFEFAAASTSVANDGSIPFGEDLTTATSTIQKHPEDIDYSTEIINSTAEANDFVTVNMSYPYVALLSVAGEPSGETTIVVDSTTGMEVGDKVGIKLDDDTIYWSTISSINVDGITFVIADGLSGNANNGGNKVFVPRIVRGIYHLRILVTYSGGADKEFDFNRVFVRDR